ncbi:MAG: HAD family hydrolase [Coriobacteriales bacterium]|nr:HAD family hydrolase [Coriobacteriales bacterium]
MKVKTVFFDVGNTLLTPAVPESRVLVEVAAGLGVSVDEALVEQNMPRMYQRYEELYEADNSLWADEDRAVGIWLTMYEYLCGLIGVPEYGAQIALLGYEKYLDPGHWALFDDVLPLLSTLKARGLSLGVISNWDSSLKDIIDGKNIGSYFDVVISSAQVGLHKPQPEIFRLALEQAGATASEAMHVGDHVQADVGGAAAVGIKPVLIDRDDKHEDGEGYLRVRDLRDVTTYL